MEVAGVFWDKFLTDMANPAPAELPNELPTRSHIGFLALGIHVLEYVT